MKQKSVGLTLRAFILALVLSLVAGSPALPPFDGVAYAQSSGLQASVAPDNSNVTLTWDAVTGADSYQIWRGEVVGGSAQWGTSAYDTVTAPAVTYTDDSVTAGATYAYGVRSVTGGTAASWMGPYPNVTIGGGTAAPTARPSVTVAADGTTAVNVSWTSVAGATHFAIQFWHAGLDDWERISGDHDQAAGYNHPGLTPGTEYYYVVAAVNAGGMGPWSSWRTDDSKITLQATTSEPKLSFLHVSRNEVRLSWTSTTNAATYDLQRKKVIGGTGADAGTYARLPDSLLGADTRIYLDSGATFGDISGGADATTMVTYYYRVQARDSGGIGGDWSNEVMVSIPQTGALLDAPSTPTTPSVSNSSVRVEWTAVTGASYYQIRWKAGDGSYSTPMRVDGLVYSHTGLTPSTMYTYQVRAVNINGPSDWSNARSATTRAGASATGQLKMPQVKGLRVTDESTVAEDDGTRTNKIKLTWSSVSGATHYEIQRFSPDEAAPEWADPEDVDDLMTGEITRDNAGSSPTWEDTSSGLTAGRTYYYVVSAVDAGINEAIGGDDDDMGEWSDYEMVTLDDFKPPLPSGLSANATGEVSIWVSWAATTFNHGGNPPTGEPTSYKLQWRRDGEAYRDRDVAMKDGGMTHHHTGLAPNTTYWYRVLAINSGGMSVYTSEVMAKTMPQRLEPPDNLDAMDATVDTTPGIKIMWDEVTGAIGYEIQRFGAGTDGDMWGSLTDTAGEDTDEPGLMVTDDNNLSNNMTYHYRVRTVIGDVKSKWSAIESGMTKAAAPDKPVLVATTTGMSMIRLSWKAVPGATAYELEYVEGVLAGDAAGFGNDRISRMDMTLGGNLRNSVQSGLKSGTRYSYRLRAALPQGVYSGWSEVVQPYTKPARPMLSATAAVSTTMTLSWDTVSFVTEAGGAGRLETPGNYHVQRRMSGTTAWAAVEESADCTAAMNKCTLEDSDLTANTLYWYRIRATVVRDPGTANTMYTSYWDQENQKTPR